MQGPIKRTALFHQCTGVVCQPKPEPVKGELASRSCFAPLSEPLLRPVLGPWASRKGPLSAAQPPARQKRRARIRFYAPLLLYATDQLPSAARNRRPGRVPGPARSFPRVLESFFFQERPSRLCCNRLAPVRLETGANRDRQPTLHCGSSTPTLHFAFLRCWFFSVLCVCLVVASCLSTCIGAFLPLP